MTMAGRWPESREEEEREDLDRRLLLLMWLVMLPARARVARDRVACWRRRAAMLREPSVRLLGVSNMVEEAAAAAEEEEEAAAVDMAGAVCGRCCVSCLCRRCSCAARVFLRASCWRRSAAACAPERPASTVQYSTVQYSTAQHSAASRISAG